MTLDDMEIIPFDRVCNSCNSILENERLYFHAGNKRFCQNCLYKLDDSTEMIPYILSHDIEYRVIDKANIFTLDKGIYSIAPVHSYLIIEDDISEADPKIIQKCIDKERAVIEKNPFGCIIYFPKEFVINKLDFDPSDRMYKEFFDLISTVKSSKTTLIICENNQVIGISRVFRPDLNIKKFESYKDNYEKFNCEYFKDIKENPPIELIVSAKLPKISPVDMLRYFESRLIGQGIETKKIVYTFYEYLKSIAEGKHINTSSWILTAPSGCGKTEVYRTLRDFFREYEIPVPVVQIDLSLFTESGFKGKEIDEIAERIVEQNKKTDGTAICFLDEADKKCIPSYSSRGEDVNASFQSNLLTFVEGTEVKCEVDSDTYTIDTGKTMFVLMGAFQNVRDRRQDKKETHTSIGFCSEIKKTERTNQVDNCFYEDITLEDMIEAGMLEELAGRMQKVINLHKLSEEDMKCLLSKKTILLSKELGVEIILTPQAKEEFMKICYSSLGIRRPVNCIHTLVDNVLAERYFDNGFDKKQCKVVINSTQEASVYPIKKKSRFLISA